LISDLLARELRKPRLSAESRQFAAEQFIFMIVTVPRRRATGFGTPMTPEELEAWPDQVVDLFLNGCLRQNADLRSDR
jgi:hypothetical protein